MPEEADRDTDFPGRISIEEGLESDHFHGRKQKLPVMLGRDCPSCNRRVTDRFMKLGTVHQCPHCLKFAIVG